MYANIIIIIIISYGLLVSFIFVIILNNRFNPLQIIAVPISLHCFEQKLRQNWSMLINFPAGRERFLTDLHNGWSAKRDTWEIYFLTKFPTASEKFLHIPTLTPFPAWTMYAHSETQQRQVLVVVSYLNLCLLYYANKGLSQQTFTLGNLQ